MIKHNYPLKSLNSFGIDVRSKYYVCVTSEKELLDLCATNLFHKERYLLLGAGSNILFTGDYPGIVVHMGIPGITILQEDGESVVVRAGAGVGWGAVVGWAVSRDLGGLENLAGIPGSAGAAPLTNIGAYGAELEDVLQKCAVLDMKTQATRTLSTEQCELGYRDSVFKHGLRNLAITSITLRLHKSPSRFRLHYGGLQARLDTTTPSVASVCQAVTVLRRERLPDPVQFPNAGSFFKNPILDEEAFGRLKSLHPTLPGYPGEGGTKVPAAWLIEACGWKGARRGGAGVSPTHALVLINLGHRDGAHILNLAQAIGANVKAKFGIELEYEVEIV